MIDLIKSYRNFQFVYVIPKYREYKTSNRLLIGCSFNNLNSDFCKKHFNMSDNEIKFYDFSDSTKINKPCFGILMRSYTNLEDNNIYYLILLNDFLIIMTKGSQASGQELYLLENGELV